jgi:hypothetical protein
VPHSARIWNYWLGGKDHYPVDREAGDAFREIYPEIVAVAGLWARSNGSVSPVREAVGVGLIPTHQPCSHPPAADGATIRLPW